jgi:hypothetical protein
MKKQKKWTKPGLIILEIKKPEEHVLLFCKTGLPGQGPEGFFGTCRIPQGTTCKQWTQS